MENAPEKPSSDHSMTNCDIANALQQVGELLASQGADPFRVEAYHRAAEFVRTTPRPMASILESEGIHGLIRLPTVGKSIARSIEQLIHSRRLPLLARLQGEDTPERSFATVPDIGPTLARRIHEQLDIETLGELEAAARDGRLAKVPGMGKKRLRAVRESLAGRLHRTLSHDAPAEERLDQATVAELLDVDAEYRQRAAEGTLPCVTPRRFNPTGADRLPILHTEREGRHYTALYSNTAKAHQQGTTRDWVVIHRDDAHDHGQWTVINAHYGGLRGHRIICGHDRDCQQHYKHETEPRSQDGSQDGSGKFPSAQTT